MSSKSHIPVQWHLLTAQVFTTTAKKLVGEKIYMARPTHPILTNLPHGEGLNRQGNFYLYCDPYWECKDEYNDAAVEFIPANVCPLPFSSKS
jgi:hypothetical protein